MNYDTVGKFNERQPMSREDRVEQTRGIIKAFEESAEEAARIGCKDWQESALKDVEYWRGVLEKETAE